MTSVKVREESVMHVRRFRVRFCLDAALSLCTGCLTILTAAWPDWIEGLGGVSPDQGSGWLEWAMVAVPAAAFVAVIHATRTEWRRSRSAGTRPTAPAAQA